MANRRIFLQSAVAAGLMPAWSAHAAAPVRMAYFETYSPLSFRIDGGLRGVLPDAIGEVLARMGMNVEHTGYPWARAQLLGQNGEQDGICTIATPEWLEYAVAAQEPVVSAPRRVLARADSPMLPTDLETSYFQLLLSKKSSHLALLPAFDVALRQFKKLPAYQKIFQLYGVHP